MSIFDRLRGTQPDEEKRVPEHFFLQNRKKKKKNRKTAKKSRRINRK